MSTDNTSIGLEPLPKHKVMVHKMPMQPCTAKDRGDASHIRTCAEEHVPSADSRTRCHRAHRQSFVQAEHGGGRRGAGRKFPISPADRTRRFRLQPSRDAQQVEIVCALAPDYGRVVTRAGRTWRTAVERHVADATDVVVRCPRPRRDRRPALHRDLGAAHST